jgi:hypothetical protein
MSMISNARRADRARQQEREAELGGGEPLLIPAARK